MFGTFLFVSFVLSVKYHQKNMSNTFGCFLVGMALFGVLNMVGGLSGGCINPAVGLV
jgi:glycerol uptake facilitator-like aquaporin